MFEHLDNKDFASTEHTGWKEMKDRDFTLELSDGTVVCVGAMTNSRHPDVKAFQFPSAAMSPFNHQNLPAARRGEERSESVFSASL